MTTQEILASLSSLEQELKNIKAARILAEDTITSYKEVKSEIQKFFSEFERVTASLNTVADAFNASEASLSVELSNSIDAVKAELEMINSAFASQCNAAVLHFVESVNQSATELKQTTVNLTDDYASNNKSFKDNIAELTKLQSSLTAASDSIVSLKHDIAKLQNELKSSQENQDKSLEKIASDLKSANDSQTQIMNRLSEDLKSSQKAQDDDLSDIKDKVTAIAVSQPKHEAKTDTAISNIASAKSAIEEKISALESSISEVKHNVANVKIIGIINLVVIIVAIILILVK